MFGELPNFFDRDFAVGYFLPVVTFLVASLAMATAFNMFPSLLSSWQTNLVIGTTIFAVVSWLLATLLVVTSRMSLRLLEGYGEYNPFKLISYQKSRYNELTTRFNTLSKEYEKCIEKQSKLPQVSQEENETIRTNRKEIQEAMDKIRKDGAKIELQLAERFPTEQQWVLPTAFGNTIRAFETYSKAMYGIDAISGWSRLLTVMPKDFRELIDEAKAEMDFWVNVWFLSIVVIIEYMGLAFWNSTLVAISLIWPVAAIVVINFARLRARSAAKGWGDLVKASFDAYLPALRVKLELPVEADPEQEKKRWDNFSRAVSYRNPRYLPSRSGQRPQEDDKDNNGLAN